jgi:hypothetical protein
VSVKLKFELPIVPLEGDHLFDIARKRMTNTPGELIDLGYWKNKVSIHSFSDNSKFSFRFGAYEVSRAHHPLVPAFAAMSMGMTGKALAAVLHHHGATFDHVTDLQYEQSDIVHTPCYVETPEDAARHIGWMYDTLIGAFCEHHDLANLLKPESDYLFLDPSLELALLKTPLERLWPLTGLQKYIEERSAGSSPEYFRFCSVPAFFSGPQILDQAPDEKILTWLHKAGALLLVAEAEYDLEPKFFVRLFQQDLENPTRNVQAIIRALNSIEDTDLLIQLNALIIQSLSNREWLSSFDEGRRATICATSKMDPVKFLTLRESTVLRLNILPPRANLTAEPDKDETYLQGLYDELSAIAPHDFRAHHFKSLGKLAKHYGPQVVGEAMDLNGFLGHVVAGFIHQQSMALPGESEPAYDFQKARENMEAFVRHLSKAMTPDYSRLKDLPSESKAFLAANGFDIKKLPGMSRKNRGQVLSDALGL